MLKNTLLMSALLFVFQDYNPIIQTTPVVIEGRVIDDNSNKPVHDVHVYIIDGEEEALTNNKGEFKIKSWQKAPYKITVEKYGDHIKQTIVVSDPSQKQLIRLKNKP